MLSMASSLESKGQSFQLLFFVNDEQSLPFKSEIARLVKQNTAKVFYSSQGDTDFDELFGNRHAEDHVYACGSERFMSFIEAATSHWPAANIHFESFTPVTAKAGDKAFDITATKSNKQFVVPADQSILQALRANGVRIDSVCENGICGTCRVRYLSGSPDHRDSKLNEADRKNFIITCVSRAAGPLELYI